MELLAPEGGIRAGRTTEPRRPLVVVATQTLEVGADIDVDVLVSELADQRAIIQRLGRLNRRGERPWARASLWHVADDASPLYGDQIPTVVAALVAAGADTGTVDLCPARIASVVGSGAALVPNTAELLPAHVFEWAKTSSPDPTTAPPELFFSGRDDNRAVVSIAWRAHTPVGAELFPPVSDRETIDVSIADARLVVGDLDPGVWFRYDPTTKQVVGCDAAAVRPGMTLVFNICVGRYSRSGGWDPGERSRAVRDLSPLVRHAIELNELTWANVAGRPLGPEERELIEALTGPTTEDDFDVKESFAELFDLLAVVDDEPTGTLTAEILAVSDPAEAQLWSALRSTTPQLIVSGSSVRVTWPGDSGPQRVAVDAYDELSADARELIALDQHLRSVGATARRIALDVGLPSELVAAVEAAGKFHDLGKADLRFQAVLDNDGPVPLAKSTVSSAQLRDRLKDTERFGRWPRGARHELLSIQLLNHAIGQGLRVDDADLIRHLVISHHGYGRPSCPAPDGAVDQPMEYIDDFWNWSGVTNPSRADNEQPGRFRVLNEIYGYWGLALLESIVRQADHLVSELTEVI